MRNWQRTVGAATICLTMLGSTPTYAAFEQPPLTAATPPELISVISAKLTTISGELTLTQLEGGYYSVAGYRLIGDVAAFKALLGQQVQVIGVLADEPSIYMTKAIKVDTIKLLSEVNQPLIEVKANRALPKTVLVDGQAVHFSRPAFVSGGTLYIPLRDLVKASGGSTDWSGKTKTASVRLADRSATFTAGEIKAEMNEDGCYYLVRNFLTMSKAPVFQRGHFYVAADALSSVLGYQEEANGGTAMRLVSAKANVAPVVAETITGSIKEIKTGEQNSILLSGAALASGETYLIWLTTDQSTKFFSGKDGATAASFSTLQVGQKLTVQLAGPVLTSYPARGAASIVTIVE